MGIDIFKTFGGRPKQAPVFGRSCGRHPPPEGHISHLRHAFGRPRLMRGTVSWGTQWGQLDDRLYGTATSSRRWCGLRSGDRRSRLSPQPGAQLTSVPFGGLSRGVLVCWSLGAVHPPGVQDSYLVDSASSHMLVSKIKPCMSKYKQSYCETANGSLNQLSFI